MNDHSNVDSKLYDKAYFEQTDGADYFYKGEIAPKFLRAINAGQLTKGQKVLDINEIEGQYIGLMKFQNKGTDIIKKYYYLARKESAQGNNLLNPKIQFEKSFMTDFLQYLINSGCQVQSVKIQNGWLELDSINDYNLYNKMYKNGEISKFFKIENET